jgi:hypothetical protein
MSPSVCACVFPRYIMALTFIGLMVQRLYRCVIPLLKAPSKHKFKTIVLFECILGLLLAFEIV